MTPVELIGAVSTAIATGVGGVIATRQTTKGKKADGKAAVEVAYIEAGGKTDAALADVMRDLLQDMRAERSVLVAVADATAAKHVDCLKLVGEMSGRIDLLEPRLERTEAKLEDCEDKHRAAATELATFKRSVTSELAKRPPSNPGFPKAGT